MSTIEYPQLEGTHKNQWIQPLAPHKTTQNSLSMSECLLELQQLGVSIIALGSSSALQQCLYCLIFHEFSLLKSNKQTSFYASNKDWPLSMNTSQAFSLKENGQEGVIQNFESSNICVELLYTVLMQFFSKKQKQKKNRTESATVIYISKRQQVASTISPRLWEETHT